MSNRKKKQQGKDKTVKSRDSSASFVSSAIKGADNQTPLKGRMNLHLLICAFILVLLVLFTYKGAFKNEFVDWDDFGYVVNNDLVRNPGDNYLRELFTTPVASNYHPVTMLSLRLNNNICKTCPDGISPAPFIKWNIILHIFNTLLVLILIFLLSGRNLLVAMLSALFFGVHPMHVESVVWISERKDVLYTFFFLSGLITYLKFIKEDKGKLLWYLATLVLFILSCLSKATAVVFPVVLILIHFMVYRAEGENPVREALQNAISLKNLKWLIPFFIISLFAGLMAYRIQSGDNFLGLLDLSKNAPDVVNKVGPFTVFQRFEISCYGFVVYILKFFVPVYLLAEHPYPALQDFTHGSFAVTLVLSVLAAAVIVVLVIMSLRKTKLYAFSAGLYFVTIALVLQFITVGYSMISDRYSYLPYIWLAFIPATLIANSSKAKRTLLLILSGCFIIMLIFISKQQTLVWRNTETLWTNVIDKYPHSELPRRTRGKYYSKRSGEAKSPTVKKALEDKALIDFTEAIKAHTKSADVYIGTGIIYSSKGDLKNALLLFNAAVTIDPKRGSAYYNRAKIYDQLNMKEEAIKDYNMALIYKTDLALQILNNRSNLFLETGRFKEAIADFDYLISDDSNKFYYYSNRGFAKQQLNDIPGAISDYRKALQLEPGDSLTLMYLKKLEDGNKRQGR